MQLIQTIWYKLKYGLTVEWYNLWYIILGCHQKKIPQVASIDETIDRIVRTRCSVSRFGDGEILLTNPTKKIGFQTGNQLLSKRLKEVIKSNESTHIICLSDTFENLNRYTRSARRFWRTHFFLYGAVWDELLRLDYQYYNTFVTRLYMDFKSKSETPIWFHKIKQIWDKRDIVFIEGDKSRLGMGNDLFDNAASIKRILAPSRNAFDHYSAIYNEAIAQKKDVLFLLALGPTATVLAYDLSKAGYQAIDIGHIDIEYEWFRIGAKRKVKIKNKYVNEAPNGKNVADADSEYESQVIARLND